MQHKYIAHNARVSAKTIDNMFDLNYATGELVRKIAATTRWPVGSIAGGVDESGYVRLRVLGIKYKAHRVVWCKHYGEWPDGEIDHINGIKSDNRICNLRIATSQMQMQNRGTLKSNTSGYRGINKMSNGTWRARIALFDVRHSLGCFKTYEEALAARKKAEAELHPYSRVC